jgi:hypothetical protein
MKWQNWVVGDQAESCIPIGNDSAESHGLPEGLVVQARTAAEAARKGNALYNKAIKSREGR